MTEDEVNEMVLEAEYDKEGYLNYQKFVENLNKIKKWLIFSKLNYFIT